MSAWSLVYGCLQPSKFAQGIIFTAPWSECSKCISVRTRTLNATLPIGRYLFHILACPAAPQCLLRYLELFLSKLVNAAASCASSVTSLQEFRQFLQFESELFTLQALSPPRSPDTNGTLAASLIAIFRNVFFARRTLGRLG